MELTRKLAGATTACVIVMVLLLNCVFAKAGDSTRAVLKGVTLSAPPYPSFPILTIIAIVAVLVAIAVVLRARQTLKRHKKGIAILFLTAGTVVFVFCLGWVLGPFIGYGLNSADSYPRSGDNYLTVNCENFGPTPGTFSLTVHLVNVDLSANTTQPYEQLDKSTAKFTYTLQPGEKQSTKVYFFIGDNVTDFYMWLTFQPSSFLMKSDALGLTERSYQKERNSDVFIERMPLPPP